MTQHSQALRTAVVLLIAAALLIGVGTPLGASRAAPILLSVDPSKPQGSISPYIFGANYGPWALVAPEMWPYVEQIKVTHLRFPAGEWGDNNDIQPFHIDLFKAFAKKFNARMSIHARLKGSTPQKAAELVTWLNGREQLGIRDWAIGNEPDLYRDYTAEQHAKDWRAFAEAMKAADPSIRLLGPEISQYPPGIEDNDYLNLRREWLRTFLKVNADLVDVVTIHRYPFPADSSGAPTTIAQLRESAYTWEALIADVRAVIAETTERDLPIGITEVNSHWNKPIEGEATTDSHYNAIWWAYSLGTFIRQKVEIVNYFALSTYGDTAAYGLLGKYDVRPTYYVYQLYKAFGETLLASESSQREVQITAARTEDGRLTLMLVNLADEARETTLNITGQAEFTVREAYQLTNGSKGAALSDLRNVFMLPAQSVTLVVVE